MDKDIRTKLEEANEKNYPRVRQEMLAMLSIEERAHVYALEHFPYSPYYEETFEEYKLIAEEQKAIDNKRMDGLLQYLEELEAHYRDLGQYDDGKPIRRAIEYIKEMEE